MFLGVPDFLLSPETRKRQMMREKAEEERRMGECVEWDPKMPFFEELNIRASSYKPVSLFEIKASKNHPNDESDTSCFALSPSGNFCYYERKLPRGAKLWTAYGRRRGTVLFDGVVRIPALFQRAANQNYWRREPWMSYTPMEVMTLRCGTRFAKGKVIIAGLGMGHQLEEVCKRKKVKEIILVEKEEELVKWILPRLELCGRDIEVVVGDAQELIPKMEANAALIDIYPSYGGNRFPRCPGIDKVWVWGSQYTQ